MSRLTIDVTDQQHQALKAAAALDGKTIKQYVLERVLPDQSQREDAALDELKQLIGQRLAEARRGDVVEGSITELGERWRAANPDA